MSSTPSNDAATLQYAVPEQSAPARLWGRHGRALITMFDQGLVSIANFATNFLLLHHFAKDSDHYAYYTLAFNLMIWVSECHATLVFTPHTILSPRRTGEGLRRFHGSTLLHHFGVSVLATIALLIAGAFTHPSDPEMSGVLLMLGAGSVVIGLRNYARPYSFTARKPVVAAVMDLGVCVLQVGLILLLGKIGKLNAATAIGAISVASAIPAIIWLLCYRKSFTPTFAGATQDLREEWPNTRWVLLSGIVWVAGMQLYPWLIKSIQGNHEVALWGACYTLAAVANPLLMGLQNFTGPRIAEAYTERDRKSFVRFVYETAAWTSLLMVGPAILLSIFANSALTWISRGEFTGHQVAITLICSAIVLQAITFTLSRGLFALHRADLDLYCNFGPLILLFTVGAYLVYGYGTTGAALSLLIAQGLSCTSRAVLFQYAARHGEAPTKIDPFPTELRGEL